MPLEPYNEDTVCIKCGDDKATASYIYEEGRLLVIQENAPVLARTCKRCGYIWYEKPLDQ